MTLVRAAAERAKPDSERFPGYSDSAIPLAEKRLLDERPIYPWLDELTMGWSLSKAREYLGADHPQTKILLGKESPEALAKRTVEGTRLADPAFRRSLLDGGTAAILASKDPMIAYARSVDANDRALQKRYDELVDAPLQELFGRQVLESMDHDVVGLHRIGNGGDGTVRRGDVLWQVVDHPIGNVFEAVEPQEVERRLGLGEARALP